MYRRINRVHLHVEQMRIHALHDESRELGLHKHFARVLNRYVLPRPLRMIAVRLEENPAHSLGVVGWLNLVLDDVPDLAIPLALAETRATLDDHADLAPKKLMPVLICVLADVVLLAVLVLQPELGCALQRVENRLVLTRGEYLLQTVLERKHVCVIHHRANKHHFELAPLVLHQNCHAVGLAECARRSSTHAHDYALREFVPFLAMLLRLVAVRKAAYHAQVRATDLPAAKFLDWCLAVLLHNPVVQLA